MIEVKTTSSVPKRNMQNRVFASSGESLKQLVACETGYILTPLRNPSRSKDGYVEDFKSLPDYVLIDGVEFEKCLSNVVSYTNGPHRLLCAEYYRVDYKGRIKNCGNWEEDGVIRPNHPMILRRELLQPTRILTMKY